MAARKRRFKIALPALEDLSKPSQWRQQHSAFEPPSYDADPDTGRVVTHHRAVDTLGMMLRNGTISQELYDTGLLFRALSRKAAIDRVMTTSFLRMPDSGWITCRKPTCTPGSDSPTPWMCSVAMTRRSAPAPGTSSAVRHRCGNGHCGRAGQVGRSRRRTRRGRGRGLGCAGGSLRPADTPASGMSGLCGQIKMRTA